MFFFPEEFKIVDVQHARIGRGLDLVLVCGWLISNVPAFLCQPLPSLAGYSDNFFSTITVLLVVINI